MDTEPPAGPTHIDHLQGRSQPGEGGHEVSQTNARRRSLVLVLGLLASFAVLWITASVGDRAQAQQNTPAAGTVTITGTVGIGELLTVEVSGITDADGLTNITDAADLTDPEFLVLWLTGPTSDPTDATGRLYAYGESYHVLPLDAGLRIMVSVSFYDDAGNLEIIYSVATGVVATVAPAPPGDLTASSTAPGELSLRWQAPSWSIQDWLAQRSNVGNGGSDITGYKVQWKLSTGSWSVPADVSEETAAGETHTITNLTGGQTYTLRVVATNEVGDSEPSREITQAAQAQPNTPATGTVTITGTVGIGELLTAHASGITDADGLTNPTFFFLWLAGPTSDPTDADIRLFAYQERYHVLPDDAGLRIMVGVSFHDDAGNLEAIHSAATAVVATVAPAPPRNLTASSTAQGEISLRWQGPSWSIQDWFDERSNVGNGGSDITGYKVQWKLSTGSWNVPADVSEETAAVSEETAAGEPHIITNLTGGQTYTLRVIATNGVGDSEPSREITRAMNRFATGAPTITGTPRVGEVLTVDTSSITDEDGLTDPRFSNGWRVVPPRQTDILLRLYNQHDYLVPPVDVGRTIEARVSFFDDANFTEALQSTATTEVAASSPDPPRNLTASPVGGGALNVEWEAPIWNLTDWLFHGSSAIGDGGSDITSYTVWWKEAADSWTNPSDVSSATVTGMTHAITGLTLGVPYSLRVVATNAIGDSIPSPDLTVTARNPPITFVGGGGGGGRSGPTPSDVDFEWNVTRDLEELDGGNDRATGVWSDGTTLWVADNADGAGDAVYAYDLASGERVEEREFDLAEANRAPRGIWSDRTTIWVSDSGQNRLFAHNLESGERRPERDIALAERNRDARGIWSDEETMWVLDSRADALFAYDFESGEVLAEYALDAANSDPHGIWSDRTTVWVSDHGAKRLFAYRLPAPEGPAAEDADDDARELERVRNEEFSKLSRAGNNSPRGIWSDGDVMYVADESDDRVYTYNMPDAIDARLASLTLSGVDIGESDPGRTDYEGAVAGGVTETTVEAEAMQPRTDVAIDPPDADGDDANGHQVALQDLGEITVTVVSQDGSRTKTYRVQFPETAWDPARDAWPHCLRGAVAIGFSLVVYEGGSIEELVSCAESRGIVAFYVLHEGVYVSYILGAPDFVNAGFVELFPDGLPSITPLVAASNGPPSADPFGDLDDGGRQPWPECLRGDIAEGFSLVVYEGGSVEELVVCAESMDVTALYTLSEGEFVSYILGAPDFATQPFRDLFADGLPLMTPLVAGNGGQPGDR